MEAVRKKSNSKNPVPKKSLRKNATEQLPSQLPAVTPDIRPLQTADAPNAENGKEAAGTPETGAPQVEFRLSEQETRDDVHKTAAFASDAEGGAEGASEDASENAKSVLSDDSATFQSSEDQNEDPFRNAVDVSEEILKAQPTDHRQQQQLSVPAAADEGVIEPAVPPVEDDECPAESDPTLYPALDSLPVAGEVLGDAPPCEDSVTSETFAPEAPSAPHLSVDPTVRNPTLLEMPIQREINLNQRKALTRVYPEVDFEEVQILPMMEADILRLNQGTLLQQKDYLEDTFVKMYNESSLLEDELYKLLTLYYAERSALSVCSQQAEDINKVIQKLTTEVWSMGRGQVSAYDRCGDNARIEKSHEYEIATYEKYPARKLDQALRTLEDFLRGDFATKSHAAQLLKTQIEQVVNKILYPFRAIPKSAPVPKIGEHIWGREQENGKEGLRRAISILFCFVRKPFDDPAYVEQIRLWLKSAVAVLLRIAALEDHFFIVAHVLRCPPGIHKWAIDMVQVPPVEGWSTQQDWLSYDFNPGRVFDYAMLVLSLICNPVSHRESFLSSLKVLAEDGPNDAWCLVDSDGEDDATSEDVFLHWNESDIVEILHQIPLREVFKYMLLVDIVYDSERANGPQLLRLISFATHLVNILRCGLKTYHSARYRNLTKRISRLILHCVKYLSEHWEAFRAQKAPTKELIMIQVEYDQFVLRAVNSIFSSESLGAWQFMAALPYSSVSHGIMWQLLWLLHNNYREDVQLVDMRVHEIAKQLQEHGKLEDKIDQMDEGEVFYLLTTFANMAISREERNRAFIHTIVVGVFNISYIHERLRQAHSKVGRELLSRLVGKHPFVVSVLLDQVFQHIEKVGSMACYLFSELQLASWLPEDEDLNILSEFLVGHGLASAQNTLARLVLQNINYGYDERSRRLFVPEHLHQRVALILLAAYRAHYLPFDRTGYAYKQFKHISDYAMGTKESATPEGFIQYLWDVMFRLHLHVFDYPHPAQRRLVEDEDPPVGIAPSLEDAAESLEPVRAGVLEGLPPALYVALMTCSLGHYREEFAGKGVHLIAELCGKEQFTAAVEAIRRVTTLFISRPGPLVANPKFLAAVESVLQADNTYAAMVKSLLKSSLPGDVLGQLSRAVVLQVRQAKAWGREGSCVLMWLRILVGLPEMSIHKGPKAKGRDCVLFLLDALVQLAYQEAGCVEEVVGFLQETLAAVAPSGAGSVVRSVMSYVWWGAGASWPLLVPLPCSRQFPWFAWAGLLAEGRVEQNREPWRCLLKELAADAKLSAEAALKAVSAYSRNAPSQEFLLIYRWAQQGIETEMDHPALPLIWQQFFLLYFQRSPSAGSVGLRMFGGAQYHPKLKQIKVRLNELAEFFLQKHSELAKSLQKQPLVDHTKKTGRILVQMREACETFTKLHKFFRTLYLWLEQPRLHDPNVSLLALPPTFNPELLKLLLCGDAGLWTDLVHQELVEENLRQLAERRGAARTRGALPPARAEPEGSVEQQVLQRLQHYEEVVEPPPLPIIELVVAEVTLAVLLQGDRLAGSVKAQLRTLMDHARAFNARSIHMRNLNDAHSEQLKRLYSNEDRSLLLYMACPLGRRCKQHARLEFNFHEAQKNKAVDKELAENRAEWTALMSELRGPPSGGVCNACTFVEACVSQLVSCLQQQPQLGPQLRATGGRLFADLVHFMNKESLEHAPTRRFLTRCLEVLGRAVICADPEQTVTLFELALRNPHLVTFLAPYFAPAICSPARYVAMYEKLRLSLSPVLDQSQPLLLSQFDVGAYLRATPTDASERRALIGSLGSALQSIGRKSPREPVLDSVLALYLKQMRDLLAAEQFEHYPQILRMLLEGVRRNNIPLESFGAFFDALGCDATLRGEASRFCGGAAGGKRAVESVRMLSDFFRTFRNEDPSARRNGLFCVCVEFVAPMAQLNALIGTLYISYEAQTPALAALAAPAAPVASAADEALQPVFDLYEPWLETLQEGQSLFLPWLPGENDQVSSMLQSYARLLALAQATFGRSHPGVLNSIWQRYFTSYVWNNSAAYVSTMYYQELLRLPWEAFVPSVQDLRLMTRLLEPKYIDHLPFLTELFLRIDWRHMLVECAPKSGHEAQREIYSRFGEVLIKTGWNQEMIKSKRTHEICAAVADVDWSCMPVELVKDFLLVFGHSCDPLCVLLPDEASHDDALLNYMQQICCLKTANASYSTLEKQAAFFAMTARLVQKCADTPGTKDLVKTHEYVSQFVPKHFGCVANLIDSARVDFNQQSVVLVREVLLVLNMVQNNEWARVLTDGVVEWIDANPGSDLLLPCLSVGMTISNRQSVPRIFEAGIVAYSKSEVEMFSSDGGWNTILNSLQFPSTNVDEMLQACVENDCFLTLYAYALQKLPQCGSLENELNMLVRVVDWVVGAVPTNDEAEPKILLLWEKLLLLCLRQLQCDGDVRIVYRHLHRFVESLLQTCEDKTSDGLLGAIGLGRRSRFSLPFRFNCRVMAAVVAQHLTEDGLVLLNKNRGSREHRQHRFAQEALSKVKAMQGNKVYAELANEVDTAIGIVSSVSLAESQDVVKQLVNFFYPTVAYLKVLFFGVL